MSGGGGEGERGRGGERPGEDYRGDPRRGFGAVPWADLLEGGAVVLAAPFLLFPTLRPAVTAVAAAGFALLWLARWAVRGEPWPVTAFNGALLLFALMIPVGMWASALPDLTLPRATGLILGLAAFRVTALAVTNRRRLVFGLAAFVLMGLAIIAVGALAAEWPDKVALVRRAADYMPRLIDDLPGLRTAGVDANQLAGVLALYVPLTLALAAAAAARARVRRWRLRVIPLATLVLVLGGLFLLTQSRSGWIGGAAGVLAYVSLAGLTAEGRRARLVGLGVPLGALLLLGAGVAAVGPVRLGEIFLGGQADPRLTDVVGRVSTFAWRVGVWRAALMALQDFAFTGCGLGAFREVVHILYPLPSVAPGYDIAHAHNIFLQTGLDLGYPGLIAYIALLLVALMICWRVALSRPAHLGTAQPRDPLLRPVALGLAAGLIGLHVYGLTDALALGSKPGVVFWFALGLIAALPRVAQLPAATNDNRTQIAAEGRRGGQGEGVRG